MAISDKANKAITNLDLILECVGAFGERFGELPTRFEEDHASYIGWLHEEFCKTFDSKVCTALVSLDVDRVILHYNYRHSMPAGGERGVWLQVGFPVSPSMQKYEGALLVSRRTPPSYLCFRGLMQGSSAAILLAAEERPTQPKEENFLAVGKILARALAQIAKGEEPQSEIAPEDARKCRDVAGDELADIRERLAKWSGSSLRTVSVEDALILLQDICRVTFLDLQFQEPGVVLPRFVVLSPVQTGNSLVGGLAFIGSLAPESDLSNTTALRLLYLMAHTLLTNVRLREELYAHEQARCADELNRARAAFIQRMAHSLQTPLESMLANIQSSIASLQRVTEQVKDLQVAAGHVVLAFAQDNVDALLKIEKVSINIGDFLATLRFMNEKRYEKARLNLLQSLPISKDWTLWADKTAIWEVVENLLTNALRFARRNVVISVERFERSEKFWYRFSVRDDGDGIDPAVRPHLFKPGSGKVIEKVEGAPRGYGLYLSQRIIGLHEGKMYLGETEYGAEFILEIPEGLPSHERKESA